MDLQRNADGTPKVGEEQKIRRPVFRKHIADNCRFTPDAEGYLLMAFNDMLSYNNPQIVIVKMRKGSHWCFIQKKP